MIRSSCPASCRGARASLTVIRRRVLISRCFSSFRRTWARSAQASHLATRPSNRGMCASSRLLRAPGIAAHACQKIVIDPRMQLKIHETPAAPARKPRPDKSGRHVRRRRQQPAMSWLAAAPSQQGHQGTTRITRHHQDHQDHQAAAAVGRAPWRRRSACRASPGGTPAAPRRPARR